MTTTPPTADTADRLRPWLSYPAWACCLALVILAPAFPAQAERWQWYPFALGLILLGLPHGALDHRVIPWLTGRPLTFRFLGPFFAAYLGLTLLYLAFWHFAPGAAMLLFVVVACLHWGQGDAYYLHAFERRPAPGGAFGAATIWLVRGGLPILLPILAFPATFARVAAGLMAWYGGAGLPAPGRGVIALGLLGLTGITIGYVGQTWRTRNDGRPGAFRRDMGELVLLAALFRLVPPPLAVGTYFCVWHSARHLGRLMRDDPVSAEWLAQGRVARAFGRTGWQCLPLTLAALGLLGGLYALQRTHGPATLPGLVSLYLSLIAALTVPHFLVVLWMDHRAALGEEPTRA